jgi:fibrillarin-like pre-rRNA processing protein
MHTLFEGVFERKGKLYTRALVDEKVYGERLVQEKHFVYREWSPWRSKFAAAIKKRLSRFPIGKKARILYLGVADGTTASHLSDIVGEKGLVVGVDVSEKSMKKLLLLCEKRKNILPVLADANQPEAYAREIKGIGFDVLYQDIAQRNQAEIFNKNAQCFLKKGKPGLLVLKAQSVSSTRSPRKVFREQLKVLGKTFEILEKVPLQPFDKDHLFVVGKKR